MKQRIYIDEVGNHHLGSSSIPGNRYLSLTGVIIDLEYVQQTIHPEMEELKERFFGSHPDDPIILHRKEILNAKYPFTALRDEQTRQEFDDALLGKILEWEYTAITICLDKLHHLETYQTWRYDPYHYCLALMLERYLFYLEEREVNGDVMAESRGGKEDRRLKDSFSWLWEHGTDFVEAERFHSLLTSKSLKVKPKASNISGLQLADIIAHPSRAEILDENDRLEKPVAPFGSQIIRILQNKYYQRDARVFGKKFI